MKVQVALFLLSVFPTILVGITTFHHDKPEESSISQMAAKMKTQTNLERQKRLLPYINYYTQRHQRPISQQSKKQPTRYTPFLESNALPGPLVPIIKNTPRPFEVQYPEKNPDFSAIYDTLVQLKQQQINRPPTYQKLQINYVPVHYYGNQQKYEPRVKTVIETYTPTNIDISDGKKYETVSPPAKQYNEELIYEVNRLKPVEKIPDEYIATSKPLDARKPLGVYQQKHAQYDSPTIYTTTRPQVNTIIDEEYVAQKYTPISSHTQDYENIPLKTYRPVQFVTEKYKPEKFDPKKYQYYYTSPSTTSKPNVNVLGKILKQLQNSNTLPHTFTPDNIDNSIKTLVNILNGLRKQQRLKTKPIVVLDEEEQYGSEEEEEIEEEPRYRPGTITQSFPANTIEGGTPGRPGIDYPALSTIPQTSFNCKTQRYKGFFGDPHTNCQVWHYCDLNGGQASFLCPNGTIFSQVALTCDWWYNVKCASTPQLYVLNERLYKYILPLAPKFPEDYSGPLVDRYLALKFQEMEEKMKNEKKKDDKTSFEDKDDSDQLQDIQNERAKASEENT